MGDFSITRKKKIDLGSGQWVEVDLYLESRQEDGRDFVIEVKYWAKPADKSRLKDFIDLKDRIEAALQDTDKKRGYIFYSKIPLDVQLEELLKENSIMFMYGV